MLPSLVCNLYTMAAVTKKRYPRNQYNQQPPTMLYQTVHAPDPASHSSTSARETRGALSEVHWITVFAKLWLGLAYFFSPGPKKQSTSKKTGPKIGPKRPYLPLFFGLGLLFWVWNRTIIMLARTTLNCPGRMNTSPEQETSIIYVTYVRTKGHTSQVHTTPL